MRIVIAGPKGAGKSTLAARLGTRLELPVIETDALLEDLHAAETGIQRTCREICRTYGEPAFRLWEEKAVQNALTRDWCILSVGGGTLMDPGLRAQLRDGNLLVLLRGEVDTLWARIKPGGTPAYLDPENPQADFAARVRRIDDVLTPYADLVVEVTERTPDALAAEIEEGLAAELAIRAQRFSHFGTLLQISTFGESHGTALGVVLDGVPPGIPLTAEDVQRECDRRRPGQSDVTTSRNEADTVRILSGVFEGRTTGAPVAMVVYNRDQDSSKYDALRDVFRPGHADLTFWKKYGIRDHRGGGRSSGRETVARVAAGAVAKSILATHGVRLRAFAREIAGERGTSVDLESIESNPVRAADPDAAVRMEEAIRAAKAEGESVGGIVEIRIEGLPAGVGDPVFGKLDARLAHALMSLGAVKGVEVGDGFAVATQRGSLANDPTDGTGQNRAGGILGGISTGAEILLRAAVKPTPSVSLPQQAGSIDGDTRTIRIEGRHDPCIVPRVVPVMESMCALVVLDAWMIQQRLRGSDAFGSARLSGTPDTDDIGNHDTTGYDTGTCPPPGAERAGMEPTNPDAPDTETA